MKINNKKKALDFLKQQFIMQIATSYKNKPAAAVVIYAIDNKFNIYFATHKDSRKSQNLLKNSNISLSIWKERESLVQADGVVSIVRETKEQSKIMDMLADTATNDKNFWPPLFRIKGDEYIFFKTKLSWARVLDLEPMTISQKESPFVELKFS